MTADQDKTRNNLTGGAPGGKAVDEPVDALRNPKNVKREASDPANQVLPDDAMANPQTGISATVGSGSPSGSSSVEPSETGERPRSSDLDKDGGKALGKDTMKDIVKTSGKESARPQAEKVVSSGSAEVPGGTSGAAKPSSGGKGAREGGSGQGNADRKPVSQSGETSASGRSINPMHAVAWVSVVALVVVVFLGMALWWQHQRFESVAREVATRLQQTDGTVSRLQREVQTALASSSRQGEQLGALSREIRAVRSEMTSMDQAWQSMSRSLDDNLVLGNVRRLLNMAQQQLTLVGNVNSTIAVLETAQSLLEGHQNQERFGDLLKAVQADLERLRSTPQVNIDALAAKLNRLVDITDKAPLQIPDPVAPGLASVAATAQASSLARVTEPDQPGQATSVPAPDTEQVWWKRWVDQVSAAGATTVQVVSREFSDLMQIRRADQSQVLLLSEEQAMLVRTNLRSMLLSAQLALLNRQPEIWVADLKSVRSVLQGYYNPESLDTRTALRLVDELQGAPIALDIEPITQSLSALAVTSQVIAVPDNTENTGVNN